MISLLLYILIAALIIAVLWWILTLVPMPQNVRNIIMVIVAVIFVICLISALMGFVPAMHGPVLR